MKGAQGQVQLSEDERLEYTEIGEWSRADDSIIYQATAVLLPLAFGAIPVALQFPVGRYGLAVFSLTLYLYWLLISTRLSWYSSVRLARARELEGRVGLQHHVRLEKPPAPFDKALGSQLSIRRIRWWLLAALALAWSATLYQLASPVTG